MLSSTAKSDKRLIILILIIELYFIIVKLWYFLTKYYTVFNFNMYMM